MGQQCQRPDRRGGAPAAAADAVLCPELTDGERACANEPILAAAIFCGSAGRLAQAWSLPAGFTAAATDSDSYPPLPDETFVEPPMLASVRRRLDVTLTLAYLETTLNGKAVKLRSMYSSIPAPTLRVNVGDTLADPGGQPAAAEPAQQPNRRSTCAIPTARICIRMACTSPRASCRARRLWRFRDGRPAARHPAGTDAAARIRDRPRPPAGRVLVSPASARLDRDAGRQRHGRRADDQGRDRSGPRDRRRAERVFVFQAPITDAAGMLESFTQVADSPATASRRF